MVRLEIAGFTVGKDVLELMEQLGENWSYEDIFRQCFSWSGELILWMWISCGFLIFIGRLELYFLVDQFIIIHCILFPRFLCCKIYLKPQICINQELHRDMIYSRHLFAWLLDIGSLHGASQLGD